MSYTLEDIRLVCESPECPWRTGAYGLRTDELVAKILEVQKRAPPPSAGAPDPTPTEPPPPPAGTPPELVAIDPTDAGAPCPACADASPPRDGKMLALPASGEYFGVLAAAAGWRGLALWQLAQSSTRTGTLRVLDTLAKLAADEAGKGGKGTRTPKGVRIGGRPITAVVLRALPFDGTLLQFGNRDRWTRRMGKGSSFVEGGYQYGLPGQPPAESTRESPAYIRELQADLLWLGYFSPSRGSPPVGIFDKNLLGAVLAFKQDLVDIYRVPFASTRQSVKAGSIDPGKFATPIHYQRSFVSPVAMIREWSEMLTEGDSGVLTKLNELKSDLEGLLHSNKRKPFATRLGPINTLIGQLNWWTENWSHRAAFEALQLPFLPFEPRAAAVAVVDLVVPLDQTPKHANANALARDPIWKRTEMGARDKNRAGFTGDCAELFGALSKGETRVASIVKTAASVEAPSESEAEWRALYDRILVLATAIGKLIALTKFWVLDSPRQVEAWLDHLVDVGTVDTPTAVYLKALREGGRIGPDGRPGYQLFENPEDLPTGDAGAVFIREQCARRSANREGKDATTMPEAIALQFFFNESDGRFAPRASPYAVDIADKRRRILMGADTNSYLRGSFDAVFHRGGEWYTSRGWGIGQATESDAVLDGVTLVRGLPILPPGATEVQHPRSFVDYHASFDEAFENKALAKYNNHTYHRDCSYGGALNGHHYDCQGCLQRLFVLKFAGADAVGRGGVFVPTSDGKFGALEGANGFFVDLERYTQFARAGGAVEDPDALSRSEELFGLSFTSASAHVAEVLRRGPSISASAREVAKELGLEAGTVAADVKAHIGARRDWPCSWLRTRILYAGKGAQAFESLNDLLTVVGDGKGKPVLQKHIVEVCRLRREGARG